VKLYADEANWPQSFQEPYSDAVDMFLRQLAEALNKASRNWGVPNAPSQIAPGR
jgi:hypothetical protein